MGEQIKSVGRRLWHERDKGKEESGSKDKDRNYKEFHNTELMEVRLKPDPGIWQAVKRQFLVITNDTDEYGIIRRVDW